MCGLFCSFVVYRLQMGHSTLKDLCGAHAQWEENMKQADSMLCLARGHGKPFCACALCMEAEKLSCETKGQKFSVV